MAGQRGEKQKKIEDKPRDKGVLQCPFRVTGDKWKKKKQKISGLIRKKKHATDYFWQQDGRLTSSLVTKIVLYLVYACIRKKRYA